MTDTTLPLVQPPKPPGPPPPPGPHPMIPDWLADTLVVRRRASKRLALVMLAFGVLGDVALHSGIASITGWFTFAMLALIMLISGRVTATPAKALTLISLMFSGWLAFRSAPWLVALDALAAVGLLTLAATFAEVRRPWTTTTRMYARRFATVAGNTALSVGFIATPTRATAPFRAVLRGIAIAAPILVLLGKLLASSDAVFASFFNFDLHGPSVAQHTIFTLVSTMLAGALLRIASSHYPVDPPPAPRALRRIEMTVIMLSLNILFGAWAIARIIAMSSAGQHVLTTRGLSYAEYARTGFFQLLWVAGITIVVVLVIRANLVHNDAVAERRFAGFAIVLLGLTLVMVVVSIQRLALYEQALGWTTLRVVVHTSAYGIGALVLLLALSCRSNGAECNWFPSAVIVTGLVVLLALNLINPDAFVSRHNVGRLQHAGANFDYRYLAQLNDEGVPATVHALAFVSADEAARLRAQLCTRPKHNAAGLSWNLSTARANAALQTLHCNRA